MVLFLGDRSIHNPNNLLQSVENRIGPKNKDDHEFWMLEIPPLR
jgi:hypothetical protein